MPGGVGRFFRTKLVVIEKEPVESDNVDKYAGAARSLATRLEHERHGADVVLVHLNNRTPETSLDSPYFAIKPVLMEWGLPSQMVTPYALRDPQWKHVNIASAIFAKAGGLPWVLAEDIEDFDMIVGVSIGERIGTTKRAGAKPRFVSYANVFDRLGRWIFFESGVAEYQYGNHEEQLAKLVAQAARRYEELRKSPPRSIAVHYYKRFGRNEREWIISELEKQIGDFKLALITIDDSHPMRLYDLAIHDGSFPRGHFVHLSDVEVLLSSTVQRPGRCNCGAERFA
jgi:argonaute-like protein implicated in RNA metabolism and viral defense